MSISSFAAAKATAHAKILRLSQSGEQPGDREEILRAIETMEKEATDDPALSRRVAKLRLEIDFMPVFSSDPRKRAKRHGYEVAIQMLERW